MFQVMCLLRPGSRGPDRKFQGDRLYSLLTISESFMKHTQFTLRQHGYKDRGKTRVLPQNACGQQPKKAESQKSTSIAGLEKSNLAASEAGKLQV